MDLATLAGLMVGVVCLGLGIFSQSPRRTRTACR